MNDTKMMFGEQIADMLQKSQAGRVFPSRIGVGKMRADVAQSRGAQERVAERVRQRIAIGVADWTFRKREFYAAKD
jgi:hypothetical protein